MPLHFIRRMIYVALPLLAVYVVATTIIGVFNNYSPVPAGDMWDGTVGFLVRAQSGDHSVWWSQHNEHRIVIARLIFWIDQKLFGGLSVFSLSISLAAAFGVAVVLGISIKKLAHAHRRNTAEGAAIFFFTTALAFSWIQYANFVWAFQSSFFLAYALPLTAFILLAWSNEKTNHHLFVIAALLGILSAGTMANGVLALPFMLAISIFSNNDRKQTVVLGLLSVAIPFAYFFSYSSHSGHDSLMAAMSRDPIGLLRYTLIYLGGPFYHLVVQGPTGLMLAEFAGLAMLAAIAFAIYSIFVEKQTNMTAVALLAFVGYVVASAFATASGRLSFGLNQALAVRYTTPTLLAWASLAIILWASPRTESRTGNRIYLTIVTAISIALATYQIIAIQKVDEKLSEKRTAALALALGIHDAPYISRVFPSIEYALSISRHALRGGLSIFGHEPLRSAARQMGRTQAAKSLPTCIGRLTEIESISPDTTYSRISGWIQLADDLDPKSFKLESPEHRLVGMALSVRPVPVRTPQPTGTVHFAHFRGYVQTLATQAAITVIADPDICQAVLIPPPLPTLQ